MSKSPEQLLKARRFHVERRWQVMPSGEQLPREIVVHPGAVVILPLLEGERVVLIRNFRIAVDETLIELPAGTLDAEESAVQTAQRELAEETGYQAAHMHPLCEFFMSPGILNERMVAFVATGLTLGPKALEPGEQIETLETSWDEAMQMVARGKIKDAKSIAALLYYECFRSKGN